MSEADLTGCFYDEDARFAPKRLESLQAPMNSGGLVVGGRRSGDQASTMLLSVVGVVTPMISLLLHGISMRTTFHLIQSMGNVARGGGEGKLAELTLAFEANMQEAAPQGRNGPSPETWQHSIVGRISSSGSEAEFVWRPPPFNGMPELDPSLE